MTVLRIGYALLLLTVLGLGVGVGAVLTVLSLGDAGEIRVEEEIARLGVDKVWFCAENPAYPPLVYIGEELSQIRILGLAVAHLSRIR